MSKINVESCTATEFTIRLGVGSFNELDKLVDGFTRPLIGQGGSCCTTGEPAYSKKVHVTVGQLRGTSNSTTSYNQAMIDKLRGGDMSAATKHAQSTWWPAILKDPAGCNLIFSSSMARLRADLQLKHQNRKEVSMATCLRACMPAWPYMHGAPTGCVLACMAALLHGCMVAWYAADDH